MDRPAEERKLVTVLFCDLAGFTSRAEELDPEDVRQLLTRYWSRLRAELERFGGTVEKFIGDAVVAVFGAPVAHEDDPERAVRAALAVRDAIRALNGADPDLDLHVRIGVNTGEALVALDAAVREGEGMVAGDVVNTAARLQAAAPVDGVLVGEVTYRATRPRIEYREQVAVEARGKRLPLRVWVAEAAQVSDMPIRTGLAPLVGRGHELAILLDALASARREREVRLVTLVGPPGIGKSRLLFELFAVVEADPEPVRWRRGRTPRYGEGGAFDALAEAVKSEIGILDDDAAPATRRRLAQAIGAVVADPRDGAWVERHLRSLVGLAEEGQLGPDRSAEAFGAWIRFLRGVTAPAGLVLALEDVHWADDLLLDFVERLAAEGDVPLLIVVTARPELLERRPGWEAAGLVEVEPLSEQELAELVATRLGETALPAGVEALVVERAAGNPLFAEEYVRMLADRELLGAASGRLPVPETVHGVIAARIDALPAATKTIVSDAAVVGKSVWLPALGALSGLEPEAVRGAMGELEGRELLRRERRSSLAGEPQYAFRHDLIRDVAYGQMTRAARSAKHLLAAEWLEATTAEGFEGRVFQLAHHLRSALELARASGEEPGGLPERARAALREAGDRAVALNALPAAVDYFRAAASLAEPGEPERAQLVFRLAKARVYAGFAGLEELAEAEAALLDLGERALAAEAAVYAYWLHAEAAGRADEGRSHLRRATELIRGEPPSRSTIIVLNFQAAELSQAALDDAEAVRLSASALAMAEELGLGDLCVQSLNILGPSRGGPQGIADLERAVGLAREIDSPEILIAAINLAACREEVGELRAAMEAVEVAREALRRYGGFAGTAYWIPAFDAWFAYWRGAFDDAYAIADDVLTDPERAQAQPQAWAQLVRASVHSWRGEVGQALELSRSAIALARGVGAVDLIHPALCLAAAAELAAGNADAALRLVREALPMQRFGASAFPDAARVLVALGRERELLEAPPPRVPSRWHDAALAYASGDFSRAAAIYGEIGSVPDEQEARVRAVRLPP